MAKHIKKFKTIVVDENLFNTMVKDREKFQKTIGGGKWSMADTIRQYLENGL